MLYAPARLTRSVAATFVEEAALPRLAVQLMDVGRCIGITEVHAEIATRIFGDDLWEDYGIDGTAAILCLRGSREVLAHLSR